MRRVLLPFLAVLTLALVAPISHAYAQAGGGGDQSDDSDKSKKKDEWNDKQAPLPGLHNAGPCPYVKVLYDAARYQEFKGGQPSSAAVAYTGEIQGISSGCRYKGADPIHLEVEILFALGRGPQATGDKKTYRYWVAVTDRNNSVLAKEYFDLPATFPAGQDRVLKTDRLGAINIPRANANVSGANFEVLVGFDVTPDMAAFNREGKRFRVNAGAASSGKQ